jgi:ferritin-like metal-binding protein YciE
MARKPAKSVARRGAGGAAAARRAASARASRQGEEKDLGDLFLETLKDLYHAEKQLVRALPKMAKAAQSGELRKAFETHLQETRGHADRLEKIFAMSGKRAQTKPCHGMMGLVEEGEEVIKEFKGSEALDAGLVAAAQAVEHYEISRYGTLKAWAEQHGMQEVAGLLDQTLDEEKRTDELLTRIAEQNVNLRAA